MTTLKQIGSTEDIFFENGDLALAHGKEAYGIIISDAIRTLLGEIQLNIEEGIDYFGTVFENINGIPMWRSAVRKKILSYPFVKSIGEIRSEIVDHTLKYSIDIYTDEGEVSINGVAG